MNSVIGCWSVAGFSGCLQVKAVPEARMGDPCACAGCGAALPAWPPDVIAKGSATVLVSGLSAARMGDLTAHGGATMVGLPTVLIGG